MDKDSVLYQLIELRLNTSLDEAITANKEYQAIIKKSNEYSKELDAMHLLEEVIDLIDHYVSEQNALSARYGVLAYLLGFSNCKYLLFPQRTLYNPKKTTPTETI